MTQCCSLEVGHWRSAGCFRFFSCSSSGCRDSPETLLVLRLLPEQLSVGHLRGHSLCRQLSMIRSQTLTQNVSRRSLSAAVDGLWAGSPSRHAFRWSSSLGVAKRDSFSVHVLYLTLHRGTNHFFPIVGNFCKPKLPRIKTITAKNYAVLQRSACYRSRKDGLGVGGAPWRQNRKLRANLCRDCSLAEVQRYSTWSISTAVVLTMLMVLRRHWFSFLELDFSNCRGHKFGKCVHSLIAYWCVATWTVLNMVYRV